MWFIPPPIHPSTSLINIPNIWKIRPKLQVHVHEMKTKSPFHKIVWFFKLFQRSFLFSCNWHAIEWGITMSFLQIILEQKPSEPISQQYHINKLKYSIYEEGGIILLIKPVARVHRSEHDPMFVLIPKPEEFQLYCIVVAKVSLNTYSWCCLNLKKANLDFSMFPITSAHCTALCTRFYMKTCLLKLNWYGR